MRCLGITVRNSIQSYRGGMKEIIVGLWGAITEVVAALADRIKVAQPVPVPVRSQNNRRHRK